GARDALLTGPAGVVDDPDEPLGRAGVVPHDARVGRELALAAAVEQRAKAQVDRDVVVDQLGERVLEPRAVAGMAALAEELLEAARPVARLEAVERADDRREADRTVA